MALAHLFRQVRRGRFLDQFLVPALQGAIALPEMDEVAVPVAEDLHLDVPGAVDVFLHVNAAVAEGRLGFLLRRGQVRGERAFLADHAHAATAAAGHGLDQHRVADAVRQRGDVVLAGDDPGARDDGDASLLGQAARLILVAQPVHGLGRRADELDLTVAAHPGKLGVLGEEAVPGVDGLGAGHLGGADQAIDPQIALGGGGRANADLVVGQVEIGRAAVGFAEDGHGFDAQIVTGADDPQGDFASIGNEDALEVPIALWRHCWNHDLSTRRSGFPA